MSWVAIWVAHINAGFDFVLVRDTDFRGNSARDGGGIYNQSEIDADHTQIVRNTAATAGGG